MGWPISEVGDGFMSASGILGNDKGRGIRISIVVISRVDNSWRLKCFIAETSFKIIFDNISVW